MKYIVSLFDEIKNPISLSILVNEMETRWMKKKLQKLLEDESIKRLSKIFTNIQDKYNNFKIYIITQETHRSIGNLI